MDSENSGACEVGILFGDVAGSTRIYESLGDQRALSVINQCFRIMSEPIAAHGGIVVKTIGDELMAAFWRPAAAVSAAIEIQRRIEQLPPLPFSDPPLKVTVRMGLHFGTALKEHRDFFGDTVNVAARMVALAKGRQILTTSDLMAMLPAPLNQHAVDFGAIEVKGRNEPVRVAQVRWEDELSGATVFGVGRPGMTEPEKVRMILRYREREWRVDENCRIMTIGRDPGSDIQLDGPHTSRNHATLERRRGKWVLLDHSTNGTHLIPDGLPDIRLHREECVLSAKGRVYFGNKEDDRTDWCDFSIK